MCVYYRRSTDRKGYGGTKVAAAGPAWDERRAEIKFLLQKYFYGTLPAETPPLVAVNASATVESRRRAANSGGPGVPAEGPLDPLHIRKAP